jgi:predicted GIY-YIG superfamily endonuclease
MENSGQESPMQQHQQPPLESIVAIQDRDEKCVEPKQAPQNFRQDFNHLYSQVHNNVRQLSFMKEILSCNPSGEILETIQKHFAILRRAALTEQGSIYFPKNTDYVYVLALEEGKYYVGTSEQLENRLLQHFDHEGSLWTRRYKPVRVIEIIEGDKQVEEHKTLEIMKKYGWQNVRGSHWCKINMSSPPRNL